MVNLIKILIADDHELLRTSLAMILNNEADFKVVGQARSGQDAVEQARCSVPDIVLMDIRMPGLNGIEATKAIVADQKLSETRVLILTMFGLDEYVDAALRAGAAGFLLKDAEPKKLTDCVRRVNNGENVYAGAVLDKMVTSYLNRAHSVEEILGKPLTPRETEVLTLIGEGKTNQEIAAKLVISMATVKTHVGNLLAKLQARDRAGLVIAAFRCGFVQ